MREITQQGIIALKSGDRAAAFRLLANAVRQDPDDIQAWLWLSGAVDNDTARIDCMRQVLRIEPGNPAATQGLAKLLAKQSGSTARENASPAVAAAGQPLVGVSPGKPAAPGLGVAENLPDREPPVPPAETQPAMNPSPVNVSPAQTTPEIDADRDVVEQPAAVNLPAAETLPEAAVNQPAAVNLPAADRLPGSEPAPAEAVAALAPGTPFYRPMARPEVTYANYEERIVFRTRPSQVPALLSFWIFFFGAYFIGTQFTDLDFMFGLWLGFGVGIALELVIIYSIITNFRTRYVLTNQELRMHTISSEMGLPYGRDMTIPIDDIYNAECRQNFLQQLVGIGDLHVDGVIAGQLGHTRLRGIPQCDRRAQQIMYLVREQQPVNLFTREVS